MSGRRDPYIDFLRGTALLLLMVAHSSAPSFLAAVRTFDVPLMVFISALCFNGNGNYGRYCLRRLRRIYLPVALFLCILFALSTVIPVVPPELMTPGIIAGSFMLWNWPAIPFVWIMRVFILIALVMPLLDAASRRISMPALMLLITAVYVAQNYAAGAIDTESLAPLTFFVRDYVLYLSGYSLIALAGLTARGGDTRRSASLLALCLAAIAAHFATGGSFDPQASKYPPAALFLSYGIAASLILLMLRPLLQYAAAWSGWRYLSENSMWLYLWHTIPVFVMRRFDLFPLSWVLRFAFVLASALLLFGLWHRLRMVVPGYLAMLMK